MKVEAKKSYGHNEMKEVILPRYKRVPRWLVLQGEIDSRLFILNQMQEYVARQAPIEHMIDNATGHGKEVVEEATEIIAELRWLKAEYEKATQ